jgi:hypothetical protein
MGKPEGNVMGKLGGIAVFATLIARFPFWPIRRKT